MRLKEILADLASIAGHTAAYQHLITRLENYHLKPYPKTQQVEVHAPLSDDDVLHSHPAFALIGASRITGRAKLNDTDYRVNTYVEIRLKTSKVKRRHSSWWHHEESDIVSVQLSEVQWASFISGLNTMPIPCTLHSVYGNRLPTIQEDVESQDVVYAKEFSRYMERAIAHIVQLQEALIDPKNKIPKTLAKNLHGLAHLAKQNLESNIGFVATQFDDFIKEKNAHAKTDINAYTYSILNLLGLQALKDSNGELLKTLEHKKDLD